MNFAPNWKIHTTNGAVLAVTTLSAIEDLLKVAVLAASLILTCVTIYYKIKRGGAKGED